jgi:hypothetical protein
MVPFAHGNYKPLFISTGKYLGSCHDHSLSSLVKFKAIWISCIHPSFVLYSQTYQHASTVIQSLVEEDINVKFLVQLDKLIRLLETPIFAYLRLQVPWLNTRFLVTSVLPIIYNFISCQ